MKTVFLASSWDKQDLEDLLLRADHEFCQNDLKCDCVISSREPYDMLVVVISPVSADSTAFQECVLNTLSHSRGIRRRRLRLQDIRVPDGFGDLCTIEDWNLEQ